MGRIVKLNKISFIVASFYGNIKIMQNSNRNLRIFSKNMQKEKSPNGESDCCFSPNFMIMHFKVELNRKKIHNSEFRCNLLVYF